MTRESKLKGGVFIDNTPVEKKIAALGQKGLPVGPVHVSSGGYSQKDLEDQIKKNETPIVIPSQISIQK